MLTKSIIVADTNEISRADLVAALEARGFNAIGVASGKQALHAIEKCPREASPVLLWDHDMVDVVPFDIDADKRHIPGWRPPVIMMGNKQQVRLLEKKSPPYVDGLFIKDTENIDCLLLAIESVSRPQAGWSQSYELEARNGDVARVPLEMLQAFVQSTHKAISFWDRDLNLLAVNDTVRSYFNDGISVDDLIGQPMHKVFPLDDVHAFEQIFLDAIASQTPLNMDIRVKALENGPAIWSVEALPSEAGITITATDITESANAQAELARHQLRLREMLAGVSLAEQRERLFMARELHEEIGQRLAALRVSFGSLARRVRNEANRSSLTQIFDQLDVVLEEVQNLSFSLSSPVLLEDGLKDALQELAERIFSPNAIAFEISEFSMHRELDESVHLVLYQAARELFYNILLHARAENISVFLAPDDCGIGLVVEDDGIGFDLSILNKDTKEKQYGLMNISERIGYLGGTIDIESDLGQGTMVSIYVPFAYARGCKDER